MEEGKGMRKYSSEPVLSSYLNKKGCAMGIPVSGSFELTSRCNFNCKMCYIHSIEDQEKLLERELNADQWLGIASDARDRGLLFLLLTGGEPFLRKDFIQIYQELAKMGFMISMNTNASLYNEEIRETFLRYPPTRINATLYGGSEKTYRSLCGNASFEKVVKNLRSMKKDQLSVRLNVSLTPYNVADMGAIDRVARDIGLQTKASSYMYPPVRNGGTIGENAARFMAEDAGKIIANWNYIRETEEQFRMRAEKMRAAKKESNTMGNEIEPEGISCRAGRSSFWITWEGGMLPCGTMDVPPVNVLDIGFNDAWEQVKKMMAEVRMPKECAKCSMRDNCGVCAAICKSETGKFGKCPEYLCRLTKARYDETMCLVQ